MKKIIWSHSKLNTILTCPMTYNVVYNHKVVPLFEKEALSLGSAVHWGIENNTSDLEKYYNENSKFKNKLKLKDEQIMAEAMVAGYITHQNQLLYNLLIDNESKEIVDLLEQYHELKVYAKLPSNIIDEHEFMGIIDYLLITNKGLIVIDFKTSSSVPEWEKYLEQLYRYIYLLKNKFPEIPIYKLAIINLRKCKVKRKSGENDNSFRKRLDVIYQLNDEKHIDIHIYKESELNIKNFDSYILNLSKQCDAAYSIIQSEAYFTNYSALENYGGSQFKELLLNNEGAYTLYKIKDVWFNEYTGEIEQYRDMREIDSFKILYNITTCNSYDQFKEDVLEFEKELNINIQSFKEEFSELILNYLEIKYSKIDKKLIENYVKLLYLEIRM